MDILGARRLELWTGSLQRQAWSGNMQLYYISDAIFSIFYGNENVILPKESIPFRRGNTL